MTNLESIEHITREVMAQGIDIAPDYQSYMTLSLAIANACGEAGRHCFEQLCSLHTPYEADKVNRQYDNALRTGRGSNSVGTVFYLAHRAGVRLKQVAPRDEVKRCNAAVHPPLPHPHTRARESEGDDYASDEHLPVFSPHAWPAVLQRMVECGSSEAQRDVILLGGLTVMGASLGGLLRFRYGRKTFYPCLQTFVVAPPASGKGALTYTRHLVEPLHEAMLASHLRQQAEYRAAKAKWDTLGKEKANHEEPQPPRLKTFLIAGDNSGTGILENLMNNDGKGLICESEADTVSTAIGTDYGHWSDTLRKCFDHDRLAYNRRTDREYRECKHSLLAVLLSGTPAQVKPLIPSAENGLFSRQLFYVMPPIDGWMDQLDDDEADFDLLFAAWGREWKQTIESLTARVSCINLHLTPAQKHELNALFARIFSHATATRGGEMKSSVARMAINALRLIAVVALLRALECQGLLTPEPAVPLENVKDGIVGAYALSVNEGDFAAVMDMVPVLYRHTCHILTYLPTASSEVRERSQMEVLFDSLPLCFSRKEAMATGTKLQIPEGSISSTLSRMTRKGQLVARGEGCYEFASHVRTHACVGGGEDHMHCSENEL